MKRILLLTLILSLLSLPALAEESVYYVNPDGGQFYHSEAHCASISEAYWPRMQSLTLDSLTREPYASLEPCPFCAAPPAEGEREHLSPWITRFDTASDARIDRAGVYRTGAELTAGLYTVVTDAQCGGLLAQR